VCSASAVVGVVAEVIWYDGMLGEGGGENGCADNLGVGQSGCTLPDAPRAGPLDPTSGDGCSQAGKPATP
jgi:hypothetical protein